MGRKYIFITSALPQIDKGWTVDFLMSSLSAFRLLGLFKSNILLIGSLKNVRDTSYLGVSIYEFLSCLQDCVCVCVCVFVSASACLSRASFKQKHMCLVTIDDVGS